MTTDQFCLRCERPTPSTEDPELLEWEAYEDGTQVVCPDCLTQEELHDMADDVIFTGYEAQIAGLMDEDQERPDD